MTPRKRVALHPRGSSQTLKRPIAEQGEADEALWGQHDEVRVNARSPHKAYALRCPHETRR